MFDPVKVKFKPTARDMQIAEESGTDLAQAMLKSRRREQRQAGGTQKSGTGAHACICWRAPYDCFWPPFSQLTGAAHSCCILLDLSRIYHCTKMQPSKVGLNSAEKACLG